MSVTITAGGNSPAPAATSKAAAVAAVAVTVNGEFLAVVLDILFLALFGLVFLWRVPRLIARYSHRSEWMYGNFLRSVPVTVPSRILPLKDENMEEYGYGTKERYALDQPTASGSRSDDSHADSALSVQHFDEPVPSVYAPTHVPTANLHALHPLVSFLRTPITPGFSLGQFMVIVAYLAILVFGCVYQNNPLASPKRLGYIVMSQLPIIFSFGAKNNIFAILLGVGYEKLHYVHRFIGRMTIWIANFHALGYVYKWVLAGTFVSNIRKPEFYWALVSVIFANVILLSSTRFVRDRAYNVFLVSHIAGYVIFPIAACLHQPVIIPYCLAAGAAFGLDHVLRLLKTRVATASLQPMDEGEGLTRICIPTLTSGWHAGQHVRLRVLSMSNGMGMFGWTESHPFTIASVGKTGSMSGGGQDGLVLMVKKCGAWTSSLHKMARSGGIEFESKVKIAVEGPYGGTGLNVFSSYSGALIVAGGSGISFALSTVEDLLDRQVSAAGSRVQTMQLVWTVKDSSSARPLLPLFTSLIARSRGALKIDVFYTRASKDQEKFVYIPGFTVTAGRPHIPSILNTIATATRSSISPPHAKSHGVIVGVCGPVALGESCVNAIASLGPDLRDNVGGVDIHREIFGW